MPFYFITLILLIISCVLAKITASLEEKNKKNSFMLTAAAVISTVISFFTINIPKPEIYTTNGISVEDNEVYIIAEWPLTVK